MIKPQVFGRKKQQEEAAAGRGREQNEDHTWRKNTQLDREEYKPWSFSEGQNNELRPFDADCDHPFSATMKGREAAGGKPRACERGFAG